MLAGLYVNEGQKCKKKSGLTSCMARGLYADEGNGFLR